MAFVLKDRVRETSSSTGTGDFTLAGEAAGYRAFSAVCSVGDTFWYAIILSATSWETGLGTYSAANKLTRTTVFESSNADALVDFVAGTKDVFIDLPASKAAINNGTISSAALTPQITLTCTDSTNSEFEAIRVYRNSASPAGSDLIGSASFYGKDSGGNETAYAKIIAQIIDPTNGSEDASLLFQNLVGGAATNVVTIQAGLKVGAPTGGDKGVGTVNAVTLYENGTSLAAKYQPLDATLAALAAYNTNGILVQTAADTFAGRTIAGTANQITVTNGDGVSGNPTLSLPADVVIPTVITAPNTGLHLLDTNASHDLIIAPGSDLTADRTLTITTGDADRTLDISAANVTVSSFMATVLDDTTASAALTTLGLASGSFTPDFTFATLGNLAKTFSTQTGRYYTFGNLKLITVWMTTSAFTHTTASGNLSITGLPTSANIAGAAWWCSISVGGITKAGYTDFNLVMAANATTATISATGSGVSPVTITAADMPTGGTVNLRFTLMYEV